MEHKFSDAQIASVCHEANRQLQRILAEQVNEPWDEVDPALKASIIDGVSKIRTGAVTTPAESHENWLKFKAGQGWKYGPVKDFTKQEHPQFVPYDELPPEQKLKDGVFWGIVGALG
jgi:hypothetical protein